MATAQKGIDQRDAISKKIQECIAERSTLREDFRAKFDLYKRLINQAKDVASEVFPLERAVTPFSEYKLRLGIAIMIEPKTPAALREWVGDPYQGVDSRGDGRPGQGGSRPHQEFGEEALSGHHEVYRLFATQKDARKDMIKYDDQGSVPAEHIVGCMCQLLKSICHTLESTPGGRRPAGR